MAFFSSFGAGASFGTETALPIEPGTGAAAWNGAFNSSSTGSGSGIGSGSVIGSVAAIIPPLAKDGVSGVKKLATELGSKLPLVLLATVPALYEEESRPKEVGVELVVGTTGAALAAGLFEAKVGTELVVGTGGTVLSTGAGILGIISLGVGTTGAGAGDDGIAGIPGLVLVVGLLFESIVSFSSFFYFSLLVYYNAYG